MNLAGHLKEDSQSGIDIDLKLCCCNIYEYAYKSLYQHSIMVAFAIDFVFNRTWKVTIKQKDISQLKASLLLFK